MLGVGIVEGIVNIQAERNEKTVLTAIFHTYCLINSSRCRLATLERPSLTCTFNNCSIHGVKNISPELNASIRKFSYTTMNQHSNL